MMVRNHRSLRHHHHHRRRRSRHLQRHKHIDRAYNQHWATHNVHFVSSTVRNAVVCTRGEREGEVQTWNSSRPNGHTSSSSTVAAAAAAAAALVGIEGIGLSLCYRHLDIGPFLEGLVVEPIDCAFRAVWILIAHRCVALWQSGLLVLVDPHLFLALVLALALLDLANLPEKLDQSAQSQRLSDQACACAAGRRPATAAGSRRRTQANAPLPLAPLHFGRVRSSCSSRCHVRTWPTADRDTRRSAARSLHAEQRHPPQGPRCPHGALSIAPTAGDRSRASKKCAGAGKPNAAHTSAR